MSLPQLLPQGRSLPQGRLPGGGARGAEALLLSRRWGPERCVLTGGPPRRRESQGKSWEKSPLVGWCGRCSGWGGIGGGDQRAGQRGWTSGPGAAAGLSPRPQPQQPQGGPPPGNSTAARHHGPGDLCLASWAGLGVLRTQPAAPSPSPLCPEWAPSLLPLPGSWLHVQVVGKILMGSKLISWG